MYVRREIHSSVTIVVVLVTFPVNVLVVITFHVAAENPRAKDEVEAGEVSMRLKRRRLNQIMKQNFHLCP
jgi:hypothetical protein